MRMVHRVIRINNGLSKKALCLSSVLSVLHEEHVGSWTSELKGSQSALISIHCGATQSSLTGCSTRIQEICTSSFLTPTHLWVAAR